MKMGWPTTGLRRLGAPTRGSVADVCVAGAQGARDPCFPVRRRPPRWFQLAGRGPLAGTWAATGAVGGPWGAPLTGTARPGAAADGRGHGGGGGRRRGLLIPMRRNHAELVHTRGCCLLPRFLSAGTQTTGGFLCEHYVCGKRSYGERSLRNASAFAEVWGNRPCAGRRPRPRALPPPQWHRRKSLGSPAARRMEKEDGAHPHRAHCHPPSSAAFVGQRAPDGRRLSDANPVLPSQKTTGKVGQPALMSLPIKGTGGLCPTPRGLVAVPRARTRWVARPCPLVEVSERERRPIARRLWLPDRSHRTHLHTKVVSGTPREAVDRGETLNAIHGT